MRNLKVVLSALVLTGFVGGTALAAGSTAPASGTAVASAVHATPVKHKGVKHSKTRKTAKHNDKTLGATGNSPAASGAH